MLISNSHQFIFFHVAKTAGISIRKSLEKHAQEPEKFKIKRPPKTIDGKPNRFYSVWESLLLHATAIDAREELPREIYDNYYKFAFVRNPWDWQVSMYHFILQEPSHIRHNQVKSMGSFEEYLDWIINTPKPYPKGAPKFQYEMICDKNMESMVDFVGRFESLTQDFNKVCQKIGVSAFLPHSNKSSHRDYRSVYDETTREMVREHFQKDIELFGYTFEG